jgi:glycosyltransferase involved in cell wall biosynthesis
MVAPTSFFADYGCHVRILEEARVLQKLGHQVTVATYANGKETPGIPTARTLPIPWRQSYEVGSSRHKVLFDALLGARVMGMVLSRRYDVIHAHLHEGALLGLGLGWMGGMPTVFDFQGSMTEEMIDHHFVSRDSVAYKPLRALERRINRLAPIVFTNTNHARRLLIDDFGCDPRRLRTLPDCVNSDSFRPAATYDKEELLGLRRSLGIGDGQKVIVYLGLLAEYQGTGLLLEAFRLLRERRPEVTLLLMGFPGIDVYRDRARSLGVDESVIFTGRIPYGDAPRYLALGDAAVAPKLSLTEGAGKILNYMAVGMPVVAFDTPVAREVLGQSGLLARRADVTDLAEKLERSIFDVEAVSLGVALRRRAVAQFDWQQAAEQIVDAYATVLGDKVEPAAAGAVSRGA